MQMSRYRFISWAQKVKTYDRSKIAVFNLQKYQNENTSLSDLEFQALSIGLLYLLRVED